MSNKYKTEPGMSIAGINWVKMFASPMVDDKKKPQKYNLKIK